MRGRAHKDLVDRIIIVFVVFCGLILWGGDSRKAAYVSRM